MQLPYQTAGNKPAFYVLLGSNQSLRLKQHGTICLGKSAYPEPLLQCLPLPLYVLSFMDLQTRLHLQCNP